jgi:hypothetical protein
MTGRGRRTLLTRVQLPMAGSQQSRRVLGIHTVAEHAGSRHPQHDVCNEGVWLSQHPHGRDARRTRRSQPVAAMRAAAPTQMKLHYWPGPGGMQEYLRDQARVKSMQPGEVRSLCRPVWPA